MTPDQLAAIAGGVRRLAMQRDVLAMAAVAAESLADVVEGMRATCYLVHAEDDLLWNDAGDELPTSRGLAGLAARTRRTQVAACARIDRAYDREVDDPSGSGDERLLAQPIASARGDVHAVVIVARSPALPAFGDAELAAAELWAEQVGPLFHLLHLEQAADDDVERDAAGRRALYREEAVDVLVAGEDDLGRLRAPLPWWVLRSNLFIASALVVAALFLVLTPVHRYAHAPAFAVAGEIRVMVPVRYRDALAVGQILQLEADAAQLEVVALEPTREAVVVVVARRLQDPARHEDGPLGPARLVVGEGRLLDLLVGAADG